LEETTDSENPDVDDIFSLDEIELYLKVYWKTLSFLTHTWMPSCPSISVVVDHFITGPLRTVHFPNVIFHAHGTTEADVACYKWLEKSIALFKINTDDLNTIGFDEANACLTYGRSEVEFPSVQMDNGCLTYGPSRNKLNSTQLTQAWEAYAASLYRPAQATLWWLSHGREEDIRTMSEIYQSLA
jgi:hypothetical protein